MSRSSSSSHPALLDGFQTVAPRYDVVLCDVWGVLHNGLQAHEAASEALIRFRATGGKVILISNAPRPGSDVVLQLDRLGVPRGTFDAIVTSGDITRGLVMERRGQMVHHLGPPRDRPIFDGLHAALGPIEAADYVVCSGLDDDEAETVEDYRERLALMRARGLWMICANPDLVVERGHRLVPCAGALALAYQELGGEVFYAGKPHGPIYEAALSVAAKLSGDAVPAKERVLAIGDAIRTDIAGASAFGIDSLLVMRGIHSAELGLHEGGLEPEAVRDWLASQPVRPNAVAEWLVWSGRG